MTAGGTRGSGCRPAPPRTKRTRRSPGALVQIDRIDAGAGRTVVLVHGGASNNRQWKALINDLAGEFRVIAPNMHGVGGTPARQGPVPYSLADAAALIERLCASIPGNVSLVGHSAGGAWAMQAAVQLGPRVDKLVLLEAALYDLLRQAGRDARYREASALYQFVCEGSERGAWGAIAERFLDAFGGEGTWDRLDDERRARAAQLMRQNRTQWESLINDRTTLAEWSARLPRRTLFIGAADTWPPLHAITELFLEACPHWSFARISEGGHLAAFNRPELVNPVIRKFLNE